jgi:hypothetical protein
MDNEWEDDAAGMEDMLAAALPGEPALAQALAGALANDPGTAALIAAALNVAGGAGGNSEDEEQEWEDEGWEDSAANASLRLLHHLPALRSVCLRSCSLTSLRWLKVRGLR